jgi:hypothetical protein
MFARNVIRILITVVAAVATALGGAVAVQAAPADDSSGVGASLSAYGRWYGAIALAMDDGAAGWSYDYKTKRKALKRAQRECKKFSDFPSSCRKIAWVRNGCLAVAVLWNGSMVADYGWGIARSKRKAYFNALDDCGPNCKRRAYTCTKW